MSELNTVPATTAPAAPAKPVARGLGRWPWPTIATAAVVLVACAAPFQLVPFHTFQLAMAMIYAVTLLGLNLLVGHTGQISLGHGAFFAVGAYTAAVAMHQWDTPYLATLPLAAAVTFALGFALGIPALRLRGLYLALVTLAIAVFLVPLLKRFDGLTGGSMGITVTKPQAPLWTGLAEDQWLYFLALAVTLASFALVAGMLRSRVGRALHAVRDNEIAAEVLGVNLAHYKTLAFAWSALLAGVAGCVYTWVIAFVSPDSFALTLSVTLLAGLVVGGLGTTWGPLLGGLFVLFVPSFAQDVNQAAPGVIFGLLIIAVMYLAPTGLAGLAGRLARQLGPLVRKGRTHAH
ncbi:branched-chain amino acid ABC transporter permease [Nocardia neocaledoniensis NBRC 108232]|uniref:Amino acid/amide ABC transporter membrane protein 2 (HAAT family) n=1 Tax=Nocardia neocaledoniensis TaxID=236511 RepID=A0A317N6K0_9NOCA|nr:branched-chain amino acid ABC transporter permease [Nocardia neocaledoniensis]PWV70642.1 amino acid/amide ABC transporter membrane protein 2 (HAAT family) [Nocardia neocaledoniensis]GEM34858.1 branched-chain amino acid ABC transporter permease [Nocardia neocaledoniensis NBRC 108232]